MDSTTNLFIKLNDRLEYLENKQSITTGEFREMGALRVVISKLSDLIDNL